MKKVITTLLVCLLGLSLVSTGALAKGNPENVEVKAKKEAKVTSTVKAEKAKSDVTEQESPVTTGNQAKNRGQERKLEERIKVRGVEVKFDVPPVIKEGRTLIPVRAVMNGLGAEVSWDAETQTVTITRDSKIIVINMATGATTVDGQAVELDVPAQNIDNRTFVPLRFIAQTLGETVEYDEETGDIIVGEEDEDTTSEDTTDDTTADEDTVDEGTADNATADEDTTDEIE